MFQKSLFFLCLVGSFIFASSFQARVSYGQEISLKKDFHTRPFSKKDATPQGHGPWSLSRNTTLKSLMEEVQTFLEDYGEKQAVFVLPKIRLETFDAFLEKSHHPGQALMGRARRLTNHFDVPKALEDPAFGHKKIERTKLIKIIHFLENQRALLHKEKTEYSKDPWTLDHYMQDIHALKTLLQELRSLQNSPQHTAPQAIGSHRQEHVVTKKPVSHQLRHMHETFMKCKKRVIDNIHVHQRLQKDIKTFNNQLSQTKEVTKHHLKGAF